MRGHGKHRRPKNAPLTRGIAAVSLTGSAALALPLTGATTAAAAAPIDVNSVAVAKPVLSAAVQAVAENAPEVASAAPVKYSVVTGDSLSKIARKYGVKGGWKKVYQGNRKVVGADPDLIRPGQKLTVAATRTAPRQAAPAPHSSAPRSSVATGSAASAPAPAVKSVANTTATKATTARKATTVTRATTAGATKTASASPAGYAYADNLEGWIRESLDIMAREGIPGTFDGIYRNIMRESSGNPRAINNWDSNALAGTPSKGLLQVIDPTFRAYHVPGTAFDPYDPVANITAACNYAADRYGSIDNVFGAY
ncbi:LysM peptidoglycan-binding domain-containing protein [Streptomyces roseicoloratus]|uniref:LysM peptidoglycan-binding domain-containing protein n=1 Tax=Streptomyces roseicoloratus TaxID=2508722 RepID=A0ABY9RNJ7_9ACTN|nr:LysM peptidoglycan-binding domain-containing protein [Streptomyces roseicoloratus]WMX43758.1 LysM peptidoglycan-binding domain-containing protein [Streptomyces roseicoloratus]